METGGKGSKAYIFPCFLGFYVEVWAIYLRWSVFGGQSEGNQNQLYLIQLGEERKLGNRNERRREGKQGQPFPQLYQIRLVLVTFRRLQCVFLGCLPPPRETCPGRRPQAPACLKIRRCTRHLMSGILDRMACDVALALAIGGRVMCRRPPPEAKKRLFFEERSMCP